MSRKTGIVFVVVYNYPGCVPDNPDANVCFGSETRAEEYIRAQQEQIAEDYEEGWADPYVWNLIPMAVAEALAEGYEIL